jgi:hypothetical protein
MQSLTDTSVLPRSIDVNSWLIDTAISESSNGSPDRRSPVYQLATQVPFVDGSVAL